MTSLLIPTRVNLLLFAAVLAFSAVGAVSIGHAHTGHGWWCGLAYLGLLGPALGWMLFGNIPAAFATLLSRPAFWLTLLALIASADQFHYSTVRSSTDPLTSAQALELPGLALLHGHEPYGQHLSKDAPISPGPGWILLLLPLTAFKATGLLCMTMLAIAALFVRRRSTLGAGIFCLLLLAGPLFQSQAANGQDLYCITLAFVALCLALQTFARRPVTLAALAILAGFIATARLPVVLILCIPAVGLFRIDRRSGLLFTALMLCTAALLDGGFALWAHNAGDRFQPLHVIGRGTAGSGNGTHAAVIGLTLAALTWILRSMRGCAQDWFLGMWLLLSALFIPEALKEFGQMHHDLRWEGSTYMTFSLPLLAALLALRVQSSRILKCNSDQQGSKTATWSAGE